MKVTFQTKYGPIYVEYTSGSMVHLTNLNEIINIVDHARGGYDKRITTKEGLLEIASEWVEAQEEASEDQDNFNWYDHYQSHAG